MGNIKRWLRQIAKTMSITKHKDGKKRSKDKDKDVDNL